MRSLPRLATKALFAAADVALPRLRGPRILIYHQVGTDLGREMEVTEADFAAQLDWMEANGEVVAFDTALTTRHESEAERSYVLTFDDGYRDLYDVAWPHLRERQLPFLLYLTTGHVESQQPLDHPRALPLSWDQIEEMLASELMTLGAHTHTHPDLRGLDAAGIERELDDSDGIIESHTSVRPRHFAYPWGYWSATADRITRTRYQTAAMGAPVEATPFVDDHLVPRLPVQRSDGVIFFRMRMRNGLRWEERVRRRLRGYRGREEISVIGG